MSLSRPGRALRRAAQVVIAIAVTGGAAALVSGSSTSCASPPDRQRYTEIIQPDYAAYKQYVDVYLQRRCGTLDCHGQPGRAYRLYGYTGFRLYNVDAGLVSGQQATVEEEVKANYQAAVSLEPEEMTRLMATQGQEPRNLILLRKPMRLERHKGGKAIGQDDTGYRCILAWLRIRVVRPTQDGLDFEVIPEGQRDQMSAGAQRDCAAAASLP